MLRHRVVTALVLAAALLFFLFLGPLVTAAFFAVAVVLAAWEWGDLSGLAPVPRLLYAGFVAAVLVAGWLLWHQRLTGDPAWIRALLGGACTGWAIGLLWIIGYPASAVLWRARTVRVLIGLVVLIPAWSALVWLRFQPAGQWLVLFLFALVASADIGAYFSGRRFGRRKLAAAVSPGKTVEGLLGGIAAALVFALLASTAATAGLVLAQWLGLAVATMLGSVVGDLFESMVKRERGIKDSGALLPGHGGLLDRLDSVCAAAPVFALGLILLRANGV